MKKIQLTTAEIKAPAQIIVLNSYFVAKTVRAECTVAEMIDHIIGSGIEEQYDENGNTIQEYSHVTLDSHEVELLLTRVFPFIDELAATLESAE